MSFGISRGRWIAKNLARESVTRASVWSGSLALRRRLRSTPRLRALTYHRFGEALLLQAGGRSLVATLGVADSPSDEMSGLDQIRHHQISKPAAGPCNKYVHFVSPDCGPALSLAMTGS